ncbi:MAG: apolipoprotein N-acyltransferase [Phycisphaerae bacterium]
MKRSLPKMGDDNRHGGAPRRSASPLWRDLSLVIVLSGVTVLFLWLVFPPRGVWALAFVSLAPWAVAICRVQRPWVAHWGSFLFGWLFFLVNLSWLMPVTGLGFVALAFYLAIYWPLAAWAVRTGRRAGISPVWSLPFIWVACEFLRGWVMTGFPWLFLAHAFYKHVGFIQISDTTGAYGVTFIAALVNGLLVEWVLRWWRVPGEKARWTNPVLGSLVTLLVLVGNLFYGKYRLEQAEFEDGPRVAVIQEDFALSSTPPYGEHRFVIFAKYLALAAEAAREEPDLLVFPETVWSTIQNIDFVERELHAPDGMRAGVWEEGKLSHEATSAFARGDYPAVNQVIARLETALNRARRDGAAKIELPRLPAEGGPPVTVALGSVSLEILPEETYPKQKRFNSALVYDQDGRQRRERYDKIHLVPFGEFVPFRNARFLGIRLHWLYRLLNRLSPFSYGGTWEYSLSPGEEYTVFSLDVDGKIARFGVPICYEDVMPYVMRNFVWEGGRRRLDFLVNISNDGWFLRSDELPQHLAICVFRAVENRIGIARAVNTGISGFIDPSGHMYALVETDGRTYGPGIIGYRTAALKLDQRTSFYGRFGDWFAILCVLCTSALWAGAVVTRWVFALRKRLAAWHARTGGG